MDNLSGNNVIQKTSPNLEGQPQVYLRQNDFDALIWQKGYQVYLDKSIKCPCRNKPDSQALSSCRNCGGSGWVFINRKETRMVLQSINLDTKFKEWSEEKLGTCKVSALNDEKISFMDRIILRSGFNVYNETIFLHKNSEDKYVGKTTYDIIQPDDVFYFKTPNDPLQLLILDIDYKINQNNWIEILMEVEEDYPTISIRYTHRPTFHVVDLTRGVMETPSINQEDGKEKMLQMPVACVARLAHYVLDQQGLGQSGSDYLHDNSYADTCSIQYKPQCNV